ncbi:hypothetical protein HPULCUR_006682 [Helicostylum pulchrum]|uniref:PHD-type domain-containing protein n=1 Tax=Helicostylum pulchrum TaxID=562976 RepID=A0ABP9Y2K2_9FUNG
MLDEKTREYRVYAEKGLIQKRTEEKKDEIKNKKKFGSFMGKLLLQSGKSINKATPKVSKEKTLKQQVLTEEPFAGLFRIRKNRNDQCQDGGISKGEIKISLKFACQTTPKQSCIEQGNNNNSVINTGENVTENRPLNGRKTRWDIRDDKKQDIHHPLPSTGQNLVLSNDDIDMDNNDDFINSDESDSYSYSESLQSDDDVLGPWIELGMIEPGDRKKLADALSNRKGCQHCSESGGNQDDKNPSDRTNACSECNTKLNESPPATETNQTPVANKNKLKKQKKVMFEDNTPSIKKQKLVNNAVNNISSSKATANNVSNNVSTPKASVNKAPGNNKKSTTTTVKKVNKCSKPIIPPIKSRHSQKTNRKIMASKKKENMTITENPQKKNDISKKDSASHFTTGAFMTRKTARTLADPEHGFYPNIHGFIHRQNVEVLNINGYWYPGTLDMMDKGKVKVKYDDWDDQEEWIIMGSRRLRAASPQSDSPSKITNDANSIVIVDDDIDVTCIEENDNDTSCVDDNSAQLSSEEKDQDEISKILVTPSTSTKENTDYVSSTLDKDPSQIFNNSEVFMTRSLARGLVDEYGFKPNSFGYRRNRAVAITFYSKQKGTRKAKNECVGYLREMHQDQVRVWYPELHQSEWLPVGSRRLRVMTEAEEESILFENNIDFSVQEVPPTVKPTENQEKAIEKVAELAAPNGPSDSSEQDKANELPKQNEENGDTSAPKSSTVQSTKAKGRGRPRKLRDPVTGFIIESHPKLQAEANPKKKSGTVTSKKVTANTIKVVEPPVKEKSPVKEKVVSSKKKEQDNVSSATTDDFLTTGAFATRRAMRQLKDKNGFTPNPYGYTNNLAVEVLNTRSGKTKFWESGTLVAMRPGQVRVHYEGWADVYDEWIMVGSRRIRIAATSSNDTLPTPENQTDTTLNNTQVNGKTSSGGNDLLIAEFNPEVLEEAKKNRKHQLVRPQDYQELGMLVSLDELAVKEAQKKKRREKKKNQETEVSEEPEVPEEASAFYDDSFDNGPALSDNDNDEVEYLPNDSNLPKPKKSKKKKKPSTVVSKKKSQPAISNKCSSLSSCHNHPIPQADNEEGSTSDKQIISLRLAQAEASKSYKFVANVYGYDYMQHVTVLHLDKKLYEGRLISMHKNKVRIHYCGWLDAFDEYITLGSRRLQAIENDHEVQCIEPNYQERYEQMLLDQTTENSDHVCQDRAVAAVLSQPLINRLSRKRLTLDDVEPEEGSSEGNAEYHKETADENEEVVEIDAWKVYCNQCNIVIKQFRYYCTYCETPSPGHDYQSFELCLRCFDQNFPFWHQHPRSSFAIQAVIDAEIGPRPIKGELVTVWEEDILEELPGKDELPLLTGSAVLEENKLVDLSVTKASGLNAEVTMDTIETMMQGIHISTTDSTSGSSAIVLSVQPTSKVVRKEDDVEINAIDASKVFTGNVPIDTDQGYKYLKRWRRRKVCAFCNDDDDTSDDLGQFIGPFVIATFNKNGVEKKRSFWAHDSCARYSPEVFCTPEGKWYNVTLALRRGRGMRCHGCKEKGATIGCFESKCNKSFHLPCSQKPVSYFKSGVIFWCGIHEAYYNKKDTYVNVFNCDGCSKKLVDESWFTCVPCASSYFSSFDLCTECYEKFPSEHDHNEDEFEETSFAILKEMEAQKATEAARAKEEIKAANAKKKKKPLFPRRRRKLADGSVPVSCCYCGTYEAETWRKGYDGGVIMCNPCFELALLVDNDGRPGEENMPLVIDNATLEFDQQQNQQHKYVASIEDYSHKPYLTRDTLSATKFSDASTGPRLASYEPQPNQLFSLTFESTYFDIPGRAPRWATHSGTDYHGKNCLILFFREYMINHCAIGTWLPQTVRRAILKYTTKDERVLSNFLGRGTDAIECFLLQRRCCGVDINPAAVALSQRNCCFEIPPGLTSAEYRPIIAQADSRDLSGSLFADESFHHVLSHPPYKDCVAYSTHLDGDLSRFTSIEDFKIEYTKVVKESWRLLKMDRRLTLGIGDNREHCFYIPVGFHLMRLYIDEGFELEELVIKRQRYCSAFGLGTYLCVQFDFLVFTHEFIATFKKLPKENTDKMELVIKDKDSGSIKVKVNRKLHGVPSSAIIRKSVVMGTVWVFKPTEAYGFDKLCMSRMVERFGKDDGNWEHIQLVLSKETPHHHYDYQTETTGHTSAEKHNPVENSNDQEENPLSEYEQQRLQRIEENNKTLLKLGLISELSEESDDVIHYEAMMNKEHYEDGDLVLMITGHRNDLLPDKINCYRQTIVDLAIEATLTLAPKGMFIVGTQDIRDPYTGKLWPMTMLVLEDIERVVGRDVIKLKEMVVTVPDGYSKDRKRAFEEVVIEEEEDVIDIETVNHDYVPIVHAVYLIFQKF